MNKMILAATVATMSAGSALAGTPIPPIEEPPTMAPVPVAGPDWTGPYVGAYFGFASGEMYDSGGPYAMNDDGSFYGGFAGYRYDFGNFVIGAEVATTIGVNLYQAMYPTWEFTRLTDLRATVGYDFGQVLVFASGGYTTSRFQIPTQYTYDGWNAGLGADLLLTDNIFIGGEFVHRALSRTTDTSWTGTLDTIQLRAGVQF